MKSALLIASFALGVLATPRRYIVQLEPGLESRDIGVHHEAVRSIHRRRAETVDIYGVTFEPEKTISVGSFNAYISTLEDSTIREIESLPGVILVEEDSVVTISEANLDGN